MKTNELTKTFQVNGKGYRCTADALAVLDKAVPMAQATKDFTFVWALLMLGEQNGQIIEMK